MSSDEGWRSLEFEAGVSIFVKFSISSGGYSVLITDLSSVWGQTLDKAAVLQQASQSATSIDPSEDDNQLEIFLEKIRSALSSADGTTIGLCRNHKDDLILNTIVPLPKPLSPLEWHIDLTRLPQESIARELVMPLLVRAEQYQQQLQQLVAEMLDKDHVIARLIDKCESSGADLTTIFPGVSNIKISRKRSQRDQLAKYVKGLTEFDERTWRKRHGGLENVSDVAPNALSHVFGDLPSAGSRTIMRSAWWQDLPTAGSSLPPRRSSNEPEDEPIVQSTVVPHLVPDLSLKYATDLDTDDKDFQTQDTPPHLRADRDVVEDSVPNARENVLGEIGSDMPEADDGSTTEDDDDDLDAPPKPKSMPVQPAVAVSVKSPAKKLGTIGGPEGQLKTNELAVVSDKTTEDLDHDIGGNQVNVKISKLMKSKLGTIGGSSKADHSSPLDLSAPEPEPERVAPQILRADLKLGKIGGKKALIMADVPSGAGSFTQDNAPPRSRSITKAETPQPRETSEERADNKRTQLKRELEEKAQAPVKKKRKF